MTWILGRRYQGQKIWMKLNLRLYPTNFADISIVFTQFIFRKKTGLHIKITSILWVHVNALQQDCGNSKQGQQERKKKQSKETLTKLYCAKVTWTHILWRPLKVYYQFLDWACIAQKQNMICSKKKEIGNISYLATSFWRTSWSVEVKLRFLISR